MNPWTRRHGALLLGAAMLLATLLGGGSLLAGALPPAQPSSPALVIVQPGPRETTLGEKRDFYVKGEYGPGVRRKGDLRVDLFRLDVQGHEGARVRTLQSHVGPEGLTERSAVNWGWRGGDFSPQGILLMPPDLVVGPHGPAPEYKVVVRERTWAALVLGGATWLPEIDGPDVRGTRLVDLTGGAYRLVVTGLSGDLRGQSARLDLRFGRSANLFGRFSPAPHMERLQRYGQARGLRLYLDDLPGYFTGKEGRFQVLAREYPNNSLEAVNSLPGIADPRVQASENHVVMWNVHEGAVTQKVEIGAIVRHGLVESPRTEWLRYDLGEYAIDCPEREGAAPKHLEGTIVPFAVGRRLALARVEMRKRNGLLEDGTYACNDASPRRVVPVSAAPVHLRVDEKVAIFGVTRPLPSSVSPAAEPATWKVANRIVQVRYRVRDGNLRLEGQTLRDVRLRRTTVDGKTVDSIYEFRHEMDLGRKPGLHRLEYVGLDGNGAEVAGTQGTLMVLVVAPRTR